MQCVEGIPPQATHTHTFTHSVIHISSRNQAEISCKNSASAKKKVTQFWTFSWKMSIFLFAMNFSFLSPVMMSMTFFLGRYWPEYRFNFFIFHFSFFRLLNGSSASVLITIEPLALPFGFIFLSKIRLDKFRLKNYFAKKDERYAGGFMWFF